VEGLFSGAKFCLNREVSGTQEQFLRNRLAPLWNPFFRALVMAQFVSFVGTWMQELARSWWVLEQGGQATRMGFLMFALGLPVLLLWPLGGALADRYSVKRIVLVTQLLLAVSALGTAILFFTGVLEFWQLLLIAFIDGVLLVFDAPAFQVFVREILRDEDFQQGLAINSVSFHLSRVVGPSLAGFLMSLLPTGWVFLLNGLSFLIIVWVIRRLPYREREWEASPRSLWRSAFSMREIGQLFSFLRSRPVLLRSFLSFWIVMTLIFPLYFTTLRVYLKDVLHLDSQSFGLLFTAPGFGALVASLFILLIKPKDPYKLTPVGTFVLLSGLGMVLHGTDLVVAFVGLFFYSFGLFVFLNSNLISISLLVSDNLRGRLSSIVGVAFAAWGPVMSLATGYLSDRIGAVRSISILSVSFFVAMTLNYLLLRRGVRSHSVRLSFDFGEAKKASSE
jgi:MFS family permease